MDSPLVSCIMPTRNRREFIESAIDCWFKQTYENKELVIVDDGEDRIDDLVPTYDRIRYFRQPIPPKMSLGRKRNHCVLLSKGDIICHWDDDDYSTPDRIEFQLAILNSSNLPITGFRTLYFWDIDKQHARKYWSRVKGYVCGTSLMYYRDFKLMHPFPDVQESEDNKFVWSVIDQIAHNDDPMHMVARIHQSITSRKDGIRDMVPKEELPSGFWENERLRIGGNGAIGSNSE